MTLRGRGKGCDVKCGEKEGGSCTKRGIKGEDGEVVMS